MRGLRVRFEGGRAVEIDADENAGVLRRYSSATPARRGSARSRSSTARAGSARWARSSTTRCSTRTPPRTSRSARRYAFTVGEADLGNINESAVHIDFMIGGPDVDVAGIEADGTEVPVLVGGAWQI